jgi:hypothetical protein
MGTGLFRGVKRLERGIDHPPAFNAEVKEEQSYTSTSPLDLRALLYGDLYL